MKKYIGLTIGPIYKTLQGARKPKELWNASYIFSYIMKNIVEKFKDRNFITPYIKDESIFKENDIGLFHDRFIFESKEGDFEKLDKVIDEVLKEINIPNLKEYLQIHKIEKELNDNDNPIIKLTPYLDTQELFFQVTQKSDEVLNKIKTFKNPKIDRLDKIASNKYFAIVHADGDNMSKEIKDLNNIEEVSKNLFEYCKKSASLVEEFGGQVIFAGGDDLLFLAPIQNRSTNETIFDLCENISSDFEKRMKNATLSFGIFVQYEKFPIYEGLEESRNQLFAKAKNYKVKDKKLKNNIAFRVTKHSGQTFETLIHKSDKNVYSKFLELTKQIQVDKTNDNFLHSIHHKIQSYQNIIELIGNNEIKLKNFFDNYFNEDEHKKYKAFFEKLIEYIKAVYDSETIQKDEKLNTIYSTLRFVKFVKGDKI